MFLLASSAASLQAKHPLHVVGQAKHPCCFQLLRAFCFAWPNAVAGAGVGQGWVAKPLAMHYSDPRRFNLRFWKTTLCAHYAKGTCKRGHECTYAHGQRELRTPNSEDVPGRVKAVRAEQDHFYDELRQYGKRTRGSSDFEDDEEEQERGPVFNAFDKEAGEAEDGEEHGAAEVERHVKPKWEAVAERRPAAKVAAKVRIATVTSDVSGVAEAAAKPEAVPQRPEAAPQPPAAAAKAEPAAGEAEAELLPEAAPQPEVAAKARPAKSAARARQPPPAAAEAKAEAEERPEAAPAKLPAPVAPPPTAEPAPTHIGVVGFATPVDLYLGAKEHARSAEWLGRFGITHLVKCTHANWGRPPLSEITLGLEWADLRDIEHHFLHVKLSFEMLNLERGSMLFYCKRGRHRSAAMLSMYLLHQFPGEMPDDVMLRMRQLRPSVQFFEDTGKYPPLAKVVRWWHAYLLKGAVPDEAKAALRW
jgi:hypothetical protein